VQSEAGGLTATDDPRSEVRQHVLEVAADILEREGAQAVSTRSVAAAAGVRAASLYQLFGDKDALLTALARYAFDLYLTDKQTLGETDDPVADMRRGWDAHVDFGLRHPAFYLLMYGSDRPGRRPPAADQAADQLRGFLDRAAAAGCLRVAPALAGELLLAGVTGATLTLVATPAQERDPQLSTRLRDSVIAAVTVDQRPPTAAPILPTTSVIASRALALDATLSGAPAGGHEVDLPLRSTELALLRDWLHRLAR
jgi:AcrR family transcriptional regulator